MSARDAEELLASAHSVIDKCYEMFPNAVMAPLFSGGHDSLCACHVSSLHRNWGGQVRHINTGIGTKYTREFVENTCRHLGWNLVVHKSNFSYERFIREKGFPGPGAHGWVYARLKDRCVYQITKGVKKTLLITGCRKQESSRRMGHVEPIKIGEVTNRKTGEIGRKNRIWVAQCFDWSKEEQILWMDEYGLPKNKLKSLIGMSGECLCGAFAQPGEIELLKKHAPDVAEEITRLEAVATECGRNRRQWGSPKDWTTGCKIARTGPMCSSCDNSLAAGGLFTIED